MDQALRAARIAPAAVGHIEAHGTGTPLGDPIEMTALHAVYGAGAAPCFVGSVKTNIGHLEAAAGVAGVIKSILLLTHRTIPRHLHFTRLHPAIPLESSRLRIATETTPWPETAPHAAVSSFGFGGTNAHLVLAPPPPIAGPSRRTPAHRPLQRQRYWFERPAEPHPRHAAARPYIHPLLGMPLWTANSKPGEHLFAVELSAREPAFLGEHRLFATPLLPAAAYLESALAAARHAGGNGPFAAGQARAPLLLSAVRIEQPLVLPEAAPQQVQLLLTAEPPASPSDWSFQILRLADSDAAPRFRLHAAGRVGFASTAADASGPAALSLAALRARCTQPVPVAECYLRYRQLGLAYGPAFAALTELWRGEQEVLARLQLPAAAAPPGADAYALHPVLLDAGFQALGVLVPAPAEGDRCVVPVGLDRLQLWRTAQQPVWATGQLHEAGSAPGRYRGDVQLLAEDGQVLCRVEGLLLQSVSRDELLGSDSASAAADAGGGAIDPGLPPPRAEPEAAGRRHIAGLSTEPARRQALDALLADELRRALCLPASAMIAPDRGFFDMGLDSLMATEIRNRLQRQLGIVLPPTVMFKFATPEELSEHLLQHLSLTPELAIAPPPAATPPPAAAPPPAPPAPDPAAGDAYERVLQLSEDALTALIDAKLKRFSE
jgi:acyl transferase domain-containing protein